VTHLWGFVGKDASQTQGRSRGRACPGCGREVLAQLQDSAGVDGTAGKVLKEKKEVIVNGIWRRRTIHGSGCRWFVNVRPAAVVIQAAPARPAIRSGSDNVVWILASGLRRTEFARGRSGDDR